MSTPMLEKTKTKENYWPSKEGTKIAVCMSGGVDSSTTAYLVAKEGYKAVGLTGWLFKGSNRCCDSGMVDAAKISEHLGMEHISKDLRVLFKKEIVDHFIHSYSEGSTPIPCITCNNVIKWGSLMEYAFNDLQCTHIATGHYAKLIEEDGIYKVVRPKDRHKDQTFMLWGLSQETLSKTVFPLGELDKDEVREVAKDGELFLFDKPESQDICFVPESGTTQDFLAKYLEKKEGLIVENRSGNVLGSHAGTQNFTIGQRKGLGVAHPEPLYVIRLDVENNIVYAGTKEELESSELTAKDLNWMLPNVEKKSGMKVMAKIRYNTEAAPATIEFVGEEKFKIVFDEPQSAITPGQACVLYDINNEVLLGGGWIV